MCLHGDLVCFCEVKVHYSAFFNISVILAKKRNNIIKYNSSCTVSLITQIRPVTILCDDGSAIDKVDEAVNCDYCMDRTLSSFGVVVFLVS